MKYEQNLLAYRIVDALEIFDPIFDAMITDDDYFTAFGKWVAEELKFIEQQKGVE